MKFNFPNVRTFLDFINFQFTVTCRVCHTLFLDPDKTPNQKYLTANCPNCLADQPKIKVSDPKVKLNPTSLEGNPIYNWFF